MAKRKRNEIEGDQADASSDSSSTSEGQSTEVVPPVKKHKQKQVKEIRTFSQFELDPRLLQAIAAQKYAEPTPIQSEAIPLINAGNSLIARARTGSGKTAAYLLPILSKLLGKQLSQQRTQRSSSVLILVPTRELSEQITRVTNEFLSYCAGALRVLNASAKITDQVLKSLLADKPDIIVSTPGRIAQSLSSLALNLSALETVVIDEADLVLSYGYEKDLGAISKAIPASSVRTILISATLPPDIDKVKSLFCKDAILLDLQEQDDATKLKQYVVKCGEEDKFLLIYVIFKLKLINGKCLVFVGDVDRCYRVKLYLDQFGIRSCVLNSELPVNSRLHIVEEFNKGVYDIIIATDENEVIGDEDLPSRKPRGEDERDGKELQNSGDEDAEAPSAKAPLKSRKKKHNRDRHSKEYGVSRGLDFQLVSLVLNFDLPPSSRSYTHRIGRTARAHSSGTALSFVVPSSEYRKHIHTSHPSAEHDETVMEVITADQKKKGSELQDFKFDMRAAEAFRYRMNDALRSVTRQRVREARVGELRRELLNSEKLKSWFEENREDWKELKEKVRHDEQGRSKGGRGLGLKDVPAYLLPKGGKVTSGIVSENVPFTKERRGRGGATGRGGRKIFGVRQTGEGGAPKRGPGSVPAKKNRTIDPLKYPGARR